MEYNNKEAKIKQLKNVLQLKKELEELKKNHAMDQDKKIQKYQLLKAKLAKQTKIASLETQLTNSIKEIEKSIKGEIKPTLVGMILAINKKFNFLLFLLTLIYLYFTILRPYFYFY